MKTRLFFFPLLVALFFSSCARHIVVNYQSESENTGKVVLVMSEPIHESIVMLDDKVMVDKKFIRKVTIKNVPNGTHKVNFYAQDWKYQDIKQEEFDVTVKDNKETGKVVVRPPFSDLYVAASVYNFWFFNFR